MSSGQRGEPGNSCESWPATTHDWTRSVDHLHLADIRTRAEFLAPDGALHLLLEVLAYADEEAEDLGRTGRVEVVVGDGRVTVSDDGRGTETRVDETGAVIRKPIMSTKDVRFFDAENGPKLPNGRPRRGISVVAALSSELTHENRRIEGGWTQTYRYGVPDTELTRLPESRSTGTTVIFTPDPWSEMRRAVLLDRCRSFVHLDVAVSSDLSVVTGASARWRELLDADPSLVGGPLATDREIEKVEAALNARLPEGLRDLYRASDGVFDRDGQWYVVWPLEQVIENNVGDWSVGVEGPTDGPGRADLVGFGDNGAGEPFCVLRDGRDEQVSVWRPLDNAATPLAESIGEFWTGWRSGSLST